MLNRPPTTNSTQRRFEPNRGPANHRRSLHLPRTVAPSLASGPRTASPRAPLTPPRHRLPRALADAQSKSGAPAPGLAVAACTAPPWCIQVVRVSHVAPPYLKLPPSPGGSPKP
jgi:hypothetical protein